MTDVPPATALRGAVDLSSLAQRAARPEGEAAAPAPSAVADGNDRVVFATDDAGFNDAVELSRTVPVVILLWSRTNDQSVAFVDTLARLVRAREGRLALGVAEAERSPQLIQALQAQALPTVVALVAGSPVPLFAGVQADDQITQLFDQLLELGAQHGANGRLEIADSGDASTEEPAEPVEEPLSPLHQEAYDAITSGDYAAASAAYTTAIAQDPSDTGAVAGRAQANLLGRLQGKSLDQIRSAAAADPTDFSAQLDVADLDLSGGHIDDAFDRLLAAFPTLGPDEKATVRARIVEMFEVVGVEDPRVVAARRRLAALLY